MKKQDESISVGRPFGNITMTNKSHGLGYCIGYYIFKGGIVIIYDEPNLTRFDFVFKGKLHIRTFNEKKNRIFTDRSLKILAGKFAMEVITENNIKIHEESKHHKQILDNSLRY